VPDGTHRVVLTYADGDTADLPLTKGFFLFEIPQAHHVRGARPSALIALDEGGDEIAQAERMDILEKVFGTFGDRPPEG